MHESCKQERRQVFYPQFPSLYSIHPLTLHSSLNSSPSQPPPHRALSSSRQPATLSTLLHFIQYCPTTILKPLLSSHPFFSTSIPLTLPPPLRCPLHRSSPSYSPTITFYSFTFTTPSLNLLLYLISLSLFFFQTLPPSTFHWPLLPFLPPQSPPLHSNCFFSCPSQSLSLYLTRSSPPPIHPLVTSLVPPLLFPTTLPRNPLFFTHPSFQLNSLNRCPPLT